MFQIVGKTLRTHAQFLSTEAMSICTAGLSKATDAQYTSHVNKFKSFGSNLGHTDFLSTPLSVCIEYLTTLFKEGKGYSTINSARSALSQFVILSDNPGIEFCKHPLMVKFMKGTFRLRPALPRYRSTWDVKLVLDVLRGVDNSRASPESSL